MDHWCHKKLQCVATKRKGVTLLHRQGTSRKVALVEELRYHLNCTLRCHNRHLGITSCDSGKASCVVGLHMLHHKIVGCSALQDLLYICKPLLAFATIHTIHNCQLLVDNRIRVVGYAIRNDVLALEEVQVGIINTDIFDCFTNKWFHNRGCLCVCNLHLPHNDLSRRFSTKCKDNNLYSKNC